jgi:hypothetical protein
VFFEDHLNGHGAKSGSWLELESFYSQDYAHTGQHKFVQKRFKYRKDWKLRVTRCICAILFTKLNLPKDLGYLIAEFVCRPPYAERRGGRVVIGPKKKKKKAKNDEDEEWSG